MALGMIPSIAPRVALGGSAQATNLVTNGGFETNTTGWATSGTNSIARSTVVERKSGVASLLVTYVDNDGLARFVITLTAEPHSFSAWVYIPSTYDGQSVILSDNGDFASATGTQLATADMGIRDAWQRLVTDITPVAGDLTGALHIRNTGTAPQFGDTLYIDDVQIETGLVATPYIETDGATASRSRLKWVA